MAAIPKHTTKIEVGEASQRLAVLIDADNAQVSVIEGLLAEVARFDGFCLVSSDSDFTGLALRIREEGLMVYGFGEQKTPEAFRNACHKFLFTEVLRQPTLPASASGSAAAATPTTKGKTPAKATPASGTVAGKKRAAPTTAPSDGMSGDQSTVPAVAFQTALFQQALEQSSDEQGWAHLGPFGSYLTKLRPDFDARNFGYKKLSDLVRARNDLFEVAEREVVGSSAKVLYLRAR